MGKTAKQLRMLALFAVCTLCSAFTPSLVFGQDFAAIRAKVVEDAAAHR